MASLPATLSNTADDKSLLSVTPKLESLGTGAKTTKALPLLLSRPSLSLLLV